jgi:hypothetical protein
MTGQEVIDKIMELGPQLEVVVDGYPVTYIGGDADEGTAFISMTTDAPDSWS